MTDIRFFFDFASPYGYLASLEIDTIAARHNRRARWHPIMLGAIFKKTGMKPLVHQPLRSDYFRHDCVRFARLRGVPFQFPNVMPMNALAASRAFYWSTEQHAALARPFAQTVFQRHFGHGEDLSDVEAVVSVLASLGIDIDTARSALQDPAVKNRLRRETEEAERLGVFGSPFVIVDGEPFWGADRLAQVDHWLATGGW